MNKNIEFMSQVAKDIIDATQSVKGKNQKQLRKVFYEIMRKYGIKQGTWTKGKTGRLVNNPEWVMCEELFWGQVSSMNHFDILLDTPPEDLQAY